jgi:hypothetical protein
MKCVDADGEGAVAIQQHLPRIGQELITSVVGTRFVTCRHPRPATRRGADRTHRFSQRAGKDQPPLLEVRADDIYFPCASRNDTIQPMVGDGRI